MKWKIWTLAILRSCKRSFLLFGALIERRDARRTVLLLVRRARMDFEMAVSFCPEEAREWHEDALAVLKEIGPLYWAGAATAPKAGRGMRK